jgi:hypothetical protein
MDDRASYRASESATEESDDVAQPERLAHLQAPRYGIIGTAPTSAAQNGHLGPE